MKYPAVHPHGVMLHHFHNGERGHPRTQGSISAGEFESILLFIGLDRILAPEEWLTRLEEDRLGEEDLCLSFDDALLCQVEVALPILEKHGLRAFWFVYSAVFEGKIEKLEVYRLFRSQFFTNAEEFYRVFFRHVEDSGYGAAVAGVCDASAVSVFRGRFPFYSDSDARFRLTRDRVLGRASYETLMDQILADYGADALALAQHLWMTDDHLRYLNDRGHAIGLHSYSHPTSVAALPYDEQCAEYSRNQHHIRFVCGKEPRSMSHPCGSYTADTLSILEELGIRCGFRSDMSVGQGVSNTNQRLQLHREDHSNVLRMMGLAGSTSG